MNQQSRWQRIAAEPYRLFFPVAIIISIIGVSLWPLFYAGKLSFYPSSAHARLMIEGFVGGFAIGFLGTALPKMLSVKPLKLYQIALLFILYLGYCIALMEGDIVSGDVIFAATFLVFIGCIIPRIVNRKDLPPPGMVLAALGILSGVFGALYGAFFTHSSFSPYLVPFSQRLLYQSFILLPILGVGSFIFPMILNVKTPDDLPAKIWRQKAIKAGIVGLLILISYWIEVRGMMEGPGSAKAMSWCRFALALIWLVSESGCFNRKRIKVMLKEGIMANGLRAGIGCLLLALLTTAIIQQQKVALDHILYIGGFGLIGMIVATRVIFGHSGQGNQFKRWIKPLTIAVALLLLGMATRVSADFLPNVRTSHHIYAAICWIGVSIIWGIAVLPSVRKTPPPAKPKKVAKSVDILDMNFRK